jgi:hypothetical protein
MGLEHYSVVSRCWEEGKIFVTEGSHKGYFRVTELLCTVRWLWLYEKAYK